MNQIIWDFLTLSDPNARLVVLGSLLLGAGSATVGCFTFLRKRALVGDAVAHALLPGVCLSFMISGNKHPLILLAGAIISGWLALISMDIISRYSRLKTDTIIGLILSVFFGIGILLLTSIQHSGAGNQTGLDKFLFGKAASMTIQDVKTIAWATLFIVGVILLFYRPFKIMSFDPHFAQSLGLPIKSLEFLMSTITVVAVAIGIQAVGVVLMAALLITPAAAARFWTDRLSRMLLLAAFFGVLSSWIGSFVSFMAPAMPTGPWIVIFLSLIALLSIFFAPSKGILARIWQQKRHSIKILRENILKAFHVLGENDGAFFQDRSVADLLQIRAFSEEHLQKGLRGLKKQKLLAQSPDANYCLTSEGLQTARRVVRLHRLWELYLTQKMNIAPDHVHHDAEAIEHILNPELERQLEKELDFPQRDPHDSEIPY
jgi:manganese/zinc/iron transport system permease protein